MRETNPQVHGSFTYAHADPASNSSWRCGHDAREHGVDYCRRDRPAHKTAKPRGTPTGANASFVDPWRGC
jgi:hypothetical protein